MGFLQEFKQFAMKGNVVDMAVGVIIGGAALNREVEDLLKRADMLWEQKKLLI